MTRLEDAPYLRGPHRPVDGEHDACELKPSEGEIPAWLSGQFVRNSGNPRFAPPGRYHWFDGDGLLHGVELREGRATYRSRFVRTRAYELEQEAGRALWNGLLEPLDPRHPHGPIKDTANTDVIVHNGVVLATWWLSGQPMAVEVPELTTRGPQTFGGALRHSMCAHPKVCPRTGELFFFGFDLFRKPYYHFGCVSAAGELRYVQEVDLPRAYVAHDIAITENYVILLDLALGYDRAAMAQGKRKIGFDRSVPARFGVVPRAGGEIRWFEAEPCYVYHTINAHEEGERVVLTACRIEDPVPSELGADAARLDSISLEPYLYRWTFDLAGGGVREEQLDDRPTEFPRAADALLTRDLRFAYAPRVAPREDLLFDGLIKYDLRSGASTGFELGEGYLGEVVFVPEPGRAEEDAGVLVTLTTTGDQSELLVLDAGDLSVRCRAPLPRRVQPGFHACWAPL